MTDKKVAGASAGRGVAWVLGAAAAAAAALAAWYVTIRAPEPAPPPPATTPEAAAPAPAPAAPEAAAPVPGAASIPEAAPAAAPAAPAAVEPVLPGFDTVRVDADGATLVAGRASAGARISILVDDAEAASAEADGAGAFAALFTLPPSDRPRVMTLRSVLPDGTRLTSDAEVIVAPFALPAVVAAAPAAGPGAEPAAAEPAVPEPTEAGPAVLIADATGVRKETPATLLESIVVDTIGYGAEGTVEIAGRGAAGAFARLYLDNGERATVPIAAEGGWQASLADVSPGIYTLRVDQIDGAGKVTSRFETPFQREAPETVTAALGATEAEPAPATTPAPAPAPAAPAEPAEPAALPAAPAPSVVPEAPQVAAAGTEAAPPAAPPAAAPPAAAPEAATPGSRAVIVTVQPGFSLWRIARETYGEGVLYVKVFEANRDQIRDPDLIYPGQIFTVPAQE